MSIAGAGYPILRWSALLEIKRHGTERHHQKDAAFWWRLFFIDWLMNTDIRISVSFWDHPKTVKLERRLGLAGVKSLQILWMWAANNKPDGYLTNVERTSNERQTNVKRTFNAEDVEIAARWNGEQNTFTNTLIELGWLDEIDGGYLLHGWAERNSWAAKADERGDKARFSRLAKVAPEVFNSMKSQGVTSISKEEYNAAIDEPSTNRQRNVNASLTPAPAPAPAPAPSPKEIKDFCSELSVPDTAEQPAMEFPLSRKGESFLVFQKDIDQWQDSFPGVDVVLELKACRQWSVDNPSRRKTKNGIKSHISRWLGKAQNRGAGFATQQNQFPCKKEKIGGLTF